MLGICLILCLTCCPIGRVVKQVESPVNSYRMVEQWRKEDRILKNNIDPTTSGQQPHTKNNNNNNYITPPSPAGSFRMFWKNNADESPDSPPTWHSGGNQRDLAREKAKKKQESGKKSQADMDGNKGLTLEQRKARDAELMRKKQEMKNQAAEAGQSTSK